MKLYIVKRTPKNGTEAEFWLGWMGTKTILCYWICPRKHFGAFYTVPDVVSSPPDLSNVWKEKRLSNDGHYTDDGNTTVDEWNGEPVYVNSGYAGREIDRNEENHQKQLADVYARNVFEQMTK